MGYGDHRAFSTSKNGRDHVNTLYTSKGINSTREVVIIELKEMLAYPNKKYLPHVEEYIEKFGAGYNLTMKDIL